eukprot:scaffold270567_cov35-Tisochrysis_lutea.AAC.2
MTLARGGGTVPGGLLLGVLIGRSRAGCAPNTNTAIRVEESRHKSLRYGRGSRGLLPSTMAAQ